MLNQEFSLIPFVPRNQPKITPEIKRISEIGPLEIQMRAKLDKLKNSAYPDTFDWAVYDRIARRFKDKPVRGGTIFKTTLKLVNSHYSCSKCHYALEVDTYGRGCVHDCIFCYAREQLSSHGYWNCPIPFPIDLTEIRKLFYEVFETDKPNKWRDILGNRIPIRIDSMSDSFMWMDKKYRVSHELLKVLSFYDYPHVIFTRSDLLAEPEYLELLKPSLTSVQYSISGDNRELTRKIEPGAPGISDRFAALKKLSDHGIWTTVRVNPLFPEYPDGFFTDQNSIIERFGSEENCPRLPLLSEGFFDEIAASGVKTVLAGFVRMKTHAITELSAACGIDLKSFYKPENWVGQDKKFSDEEISFYYRRIHKWCIERQLRFTTCYIGNGIKDYYQYQDLWRNKSDCCDVVGNVEGFKKTCQSIGWDLRQKFPSQKDVAEKSRIQDEHYSPQMNSHNSYSHPSSPEQNL